MLSEIANGFAPAVAGLDAWSLRLVERREQTVGVRRGFLQPIVNHVERGAFVAVSAGGGQGYAATSDLSDAGLNAAVARAAAWARRSAPLSLVAADAWPWSDGRGGYATPVERTWDSVPLSDIVDLLQDANRRLKCHADVVHWEAGLSYRRSHTLLTNHLGGHVSQAVAYLAPALSVVAHRNGDTQRRTFGFDYVRQGGLEQLAQLGFLDAASRVSEEALALLSAPECPQGVFDLVLLPGQMVLQIHESIGHPLELDRILGDERNYAGGSFVTLDMFGRYQYGSEHLNVTFDPTRSEQLASYAYDDDGTVSAREFLIRHGVLERPLGGRCSQLRADIAGVACARADNWNRPPIDRMANLNLEPSTTPLADLIAKVDYGVLMDTNRSWSIDDHRNKFQFGCEYGRLIENGQLKGLVRNPGYRGVSATFWRQLADVGDEQSLQVMGLATCGKGEPNQIMQVGHAAPACLFRNVEIFGGG